MSDVTVTLSERVRICHVGMFRIFVDTSPSATPATPYTPHMIETNRSRQLVERETRLVQLWPLKRRHGIALVATSACTAYV